MSSPNFEHLPPPPGQPQLVRLTGAAGIGWWWRATWPFGRFEATLDYVQISMTLGSTERLNREELDAVEYDAGIFGPRVWLVSKSAGRSSFWFSPMGLDRLLWELGRLGWPVRERA